MDIFFDFGRYCQMLYQAIRSSTEIKTYYKNFVSEMIKVGYDSLPIVILAGAFTGAVLTIQTSYQLVAPYIAKTTVGAIVVQSMVIELAAVISGLVLAGRVGARIATELGTMRVSEQIDAIESMGFNSISFLVVPRVLAGVLMFPMLYIVAAGCGIGGGLIAAMITGEIPVADFIKGGKQYFLPWDVVFGLTKAFVFGFVITSVSCYKGYYATGGAEGVGRATTNATVLSCIYILLADLVLAALLL
jgi:phospholipid/cholesterol/gamma-HCH transport system permease protein